MNKNTIIVLICAISLTLLAGSAYGIELKDKNEKVRIKYQDIRQEYKDAVNFYKDARQDFRDARTQFEKFKGEENKQKLEEEARNYLQKTSQVLINHLQTIRVEVVEMRLPDAQKQAIIAEIDKRLLWLTAKQTKIETAKGDQIRKEAKEIRSYLQEIRLTIKKLSGEILSLRIEYLISKAELFGNEVSKKITELKSKGYDTRVLETRFSEYSKNLALAKEKYERAKIKFKAIKGEPGADSEQELRQANQLFNEGHQFIKQANQYIKEAHAQLVLIMKEMKQIIK